MNGPLAATVCVTAYSRCSPHGQTPCLNAVVLVSCLPHQAGAVLGNPIGGVVHATAYDCGALSGGGCGGCLSSGHACGWCPFQAACTPVHAAGNAFAPATGEYKGAKDTNPHEWAATRLMFR